MLVDTSAENKKHPFIALAGKAPNAFNRMGFA